MKLYYVLLLFVVVGCTTTETEVDKPITIGVVAPLSGLSAHFGLRAERGIEVALLELSEEEKQNFVFVWEDGQCDAKHGTTAVQNLLHNHDAKYVLGPFCNPPTIATQQLFDEAQAVSIKLGMTNEAVTQMGDYHFSFMPEIRTVMRSVAQAAIADGVARVGIFYHEGAFGYENYKYFSSYFEQLGGEVALAEAFAHGESDFRSSLSKMEEAEIDGLFFAAWAQDAITILEQTAEMGLDVEKYSINAFEIPMILESADVAEGVVYPLPANTRSTENAQRYTERFFSLYGTKNDVYSANAHDSFLLLYNAIVGCGQENVDCVITTLKSTGEYAGANGYFTIDERGIGQYDSVVLKTVRDGAFVVR